MSLLVTALAAIVLSAASAQEPLDSPLPPLCRPGGPGYSLAPSRYDEAILRHARRRGLDPRLVKAVIAVESQFTPTAVSRVGARGLMQLMPDTAAEVGVPASSLSDPEENIRAGTAYLAILFTALRRSRGLPRVAGAEPAWMVRRVVAAYHAGPGALQSHEWPQTTRLYVRAVMTCFRSDAVAVNGAPETLSYAVVPSRERAR